MQDKKINKLEISMAVIKNSLDYIKQSLEDNKTEHAEIIKQIKGWKLEAENQIAYWKKDAEKKYVRKAEFKTVKMIVFGLVALILTMTVSLILTNSLHL